MIAPEMLVLYFVLEERVFIEWPHKTCPFYLVRCCKKPECVSSPRQIVKPLRARVLKLSSHYQLYLSYNLKWAVVIMKFPVIGPYFWGDKVISSQRCVAANTKYCQHIVVYIVRAGSSRYWWASCQNYAPTSCLPSK